MAHSSRTTQFTALHKVLKKHYRPTSPAPDRSVMEQLLFACCLEDAQYGVAEESYAAMVEAFFDWNEIRVSTVRELAEVMARLPDPLAAASRLKHVLQHVFEDSYSFDLEDLRKKNLGPAVEALKKVKGTTPFTVAYVVQAALGGHSIPLDSGALAVMRILDLASDEEVASGAVAGLERAIPKSHGVEFGSLLHQLGSDYTANPFSTDVREKLLEVDPSAKSRFPKRESKKKPAKAAEEPEPPKAPAEAPSKAAAKKDEKKAPAKKKDAAPKPPAKKKTPPAKKEMSKTKPRGESGGKKKSSTGISKRKPR